MLRTISLGLVFFLLMESGWAQHTEKPWQFAVSGDSRNCGDVVMPAIAQSVIQHKANFYWHLGDFRAMYAVDEDLQQRYPDTLTIEEYRQIAWSDFIESQIRPFGPVPVRLGIGNHELIGKTGADYLSQFGFWLDTPDLHNQRIKDSEKDSNPDPSLKPYYHWKEHNVDFIFLDNSTDNGFDDPQLQWFEHVLDTDKKDNEIRTVVVGMHRALPNSLACAHSMNGDAQSKNGTDSGRRAYADMVQWKQATQKLVYVLASHSHFYMENLYDTDYWRNPAHGGVVLPGWIVGTAGAKRYDLPDLPLDTLKEHNAQHDVWGYLLATVASNGDIKFEFIPLDLDSAPEEIKKVYGKDFVTDVCFKGNHESRKHDPPESCNEK